MFPVTMALALAACEGGSAEAVRKSTAALTSTNGLAYNGMAFNGMTWNGLAYNGLAYNGMAFNGMTYGGGTSGGMSDPVVQKFVSYLVGCALPEGDGVSYSIDGEEYTFAGSIGLAPEWKTSACDEECQRWISACMLARLNKRGEHVQISMRGSHRALDTVRFEERDFRTREAAYYGNLFTGVAHTYACVSPGAATIERVCGDSLADCPMQVTGSCDQACAGPGRHGSFRDCSGRDRGDVYSEAITVFLR